MRTANAAGREGHARFLDCGRPSVARRSGLAIDNLAVPPVILLIQSDLSLSGTEVGILRACR